MVGAKRSASAKDAAVYFIGIVVARCLGHQHGPGSHDDVEPPQGGGLGTNRPPS